MYIPFCILSFKLSLTFFPFFLLFFFSFCCHFSEFWFKTIQQECPFLPLSLCLFASRMHTDWMDRETEFWAKTQTQSLWSWYYLLYQRCWGRGKPTLGCLCLGHCHIAPGTVFHCSSFADRHGCEPSLRMSLLNTLHLAKANSEVIWHSKSHAS